MTESHGPPVTVLTCLALSPRVNEVAAEGMRVARLLGGRAVFLNVGTETADTRRTLLAAITSAAERYAAPVPTDADVRVRSGDPTRVITDAADDLDASIVALGALNRDRGMTSVWGSVARRVARRAPCSVLLMTDPKHRVAGQVLVAAVKPDDSSTDLARMVLDLASDGGDGRPGGEPADVHFVYELPLTETRFGGGRSGNDRSADDYVRSQRVAAEYLLSDFLSGLDLSGVRPHGVLLNGREGVAAVDYAGKVRADLLATPAPPRRLTLWDRFFHSPQELAMQSLPCALLLHRPGVRAARRLTTAATPD